MPMISNPTMPAKPKEIGKWNMGRNIRDMFVSGIARAVIATTPYCRECVIEVFS